jgi:hypothetical protein
MAREYYKSKLPFRNLIWIDFYQDEARTGAWADFVNNLDILKHMVDCDEDFEMESYWVNGEELLVYNLHSDWKENVVKHIIENMDINHIEKIIGDFGMRKLFSMADTLWSDRTITADEEGWNDKPDEWWHNYMPAFEELSTDVGIKKLFYCLVWEQIQMYDEYEMMSEEEWNESLNWQIMNNQDSDDDDDRIVPITDEALDMIGGKVAKCA